MSGRRLLRGVLSACLSLVAGALPSAESRADGITISGQLEYRSSDTETELKATGEERDVDASRFSQLYNISTASKKSATKYSK